MKTDGQTDMQTGWRRCGNYVYAPPNTQQMYSNGPWQPPDSTTASTISMPHDRSMVPISFVPLKERKDTRD